MAKKKIIPASIRNRNPGAMYPGPSAKKFGSTSFQILKSKDGRHKIATFPTDLQGAAALFHLLSSNKYADGKRTVAEAISKWCGGYYVSSYKSAVQDKAGIAPDTVLTRSLLCNEDFAVALGKAMAWQEAGRAYPLGDEDWSRALRMVIPEATKMAAPAPIAEGGAAGEEEIEEEWPPLPNLKPLPDNPLPLSKPEQRLEEAAKNSGTIKGGLVSFFGSLIKTFQEGIQYATEGLTTMGPLASAARIELPVLAAMLMFGGLLLVIVRRADAAVEGKVG